MQFRKAVVHGKGDLRIETESLERELEPGEMLVRTEVTALSTGTDLGNYLGDSTYVPGAPDYPREVGYSNIGVIQSTGERVFSMRAHRSGFVAKPGELLVRVPEEVSSEEASLSYLTQLGLAALRQARYEPGENVVVIGLGVIGLCTVAVSRAMGAMVIGVANSAIRARAAIHMGARACLQADDPDLLATTTRQYRGEAADIVVLTSNSWDSYFLALSLARFGGRVSILGFPGRDQGPPSHNPLHPAPFYEKQLTLTGAGHSPRLECGAEDLRFNLRRNLEYILDLMADRRLTLDSLITHRLPFDRMTEAYELAKAHSKELIAAVFDWRGSTS